MQLRAVAERLKHEYTGQIMGVLHANISPAISVRANRGCNYAFRLMKQSPPRRCYLVSVGSRARPARIHPSRRRKISREPLHIRGTPETLENGGVSFWSAGFSDATFNRQLVFQELSANGPATLIIKFIFIRLPSRLKYNGASARGGSLHVDRFNTVIFDGGCRFCLRTRFHAVSSEV